MSVGLQVKKTAGEPEVAGRKEACCGRKGGARSTLGALEWIALGSNVQRLNAENSRNSHANTAQRCLRDCAKAFDLITTVLPL
ncbi:MAG: hypothetical protein JWN85_2973 [Gammaproteobacteria bacterium]|nr:hypothetical protein [Gammaproteobacteria bacterium]